MTQAKTRSAVISRLALLAGVGFAALGLGVLFHELSSAHLVSQSFRPLEESDRATAAGGRFLFDELYNADPAKLTRADFDRALEDSESSYEKASGLKIKSDQRKHILWPRVQSAPYRKAPLAIVYLHGFSAGPLELEPTISTLAEELRAPLLVTRLEGHGLENTNNGASEAMSRARARDWWRDTNEAMIVGNMLGERVLLIGTSTGAALALTYADLKEGRGSSDGPAAVILLSPNYRVQAFGAWLLEAALGRWLATLFIGAEREFAPQNALHAERWTTRYRSEAVHEMLLVAKRARGVGVESLSMPVFTVYAPEETVVDTSEIAKRAELFKNPKSQTLAVDWLKRHELASATFNPELVPRLVETLRLWVRSAIEFEIGPREK